MTHNNIKVYTKEAEEGRFLVSTLDMSESTTDVNFVNHLFQILRLKQTDGRYFAYTFGFNFGG